MSTPDEPTLSHDSLDALIAAYMLSVEAGEVPNRQELLDRHPEQAEWLADFFADLDRMDRVAAPLRLAEPLDETTGGEGQGTHSSASIRYFGDYELLEEIARGGMGVVFKARQTSLNRMVALKMILGGTFATDKDVARFRAEAEAAANLDHPHIVPIYEVGEHDRQQYYAMKFVEGTSLARQPRTDARGEVTAMLDVIRAVHHAHQRGVLHRDLKPSNIVVDSKGTRYVTDFGLAKRLENKDKSLTEQGQVLGTPRYMSPEQASGRKDLTVAADVYSLGVILFERLTGETPFKGDNVLTLLRQVRDQPPARPSAIAPNVDRDLETVVLKCLDKEPTRRYPSAEALADDLTRWLKGEPILARHVGQAERALLWCRRNPVVSGLTATVAASLLIGIVASTFFAFKERQARDLAEVAKKQADEARDEMEGHLARGLSKPLELTPMLYKSASLSAPETESLWELSHLGQTNIGLRFLDEATRDPFSTQQLCARAEPALVAAIGLDENKRNQAIDLLKTRLADSQKSPPEKGDLAFIGLELVDRPGSLSEVCADSIMAVLNCKPADAVRRRWFGEPASVQSPNMRMMRMGGMMGMGGSRGGSITPERDQWLTSSLRRIETRIAPQKCSEALITALSLETDEGCASVLRDEIKALVLGMPLLDSKSICRRLCTLCCKGLNQKGDFGPRANAGRNLSLIAVRLEPTEAVEVLIKALESDLSWETSRKQVTRSRMGGLGFGAPALDVRQPITDAIIEAASRMPLNDAKAACDRASSILVQFLDRRVVEVDRSAIANMLNAFSDRMPAPHASTFLMSRLERESDVRACNSLVNGLLAACLRLDPTEASFVHKRLWSILSSRLDRANEDYELRELRGAIREVASRMSDIEAADVAKSLTARILACADEERLNRLLWSISGLESRMSRLMAADVAKSLTSTILACTGQERLNRAELYGGAISMIAKHLSSAEARATCEPVAQLLAKKLSEKPSHELLSLYASMNIDHRLPDAVNAMRFIAKIAKRPEAGAGEDPVFHWYTDAEFRSPELAFAARIHAEAINIETDPETRWWLCASLSHIANNMTSDEAARNCGTVAEHLIDAFRQRDELVGELSFEGIIQVLDGKGAQHLSAFAKNLTDQLSERLDSYTFWSMFSTKFPSIVARLPLTERKRISRHAAEIVFAILKAKGRARQFSLLPALVSIQQTMDPDDASKLFTDALLQIPDDFVQQELAKVLAGTTRNLPTAEALDTLTRALDRGFYASEQVSKSASSASSLILARSIAGLLGNLKSNGEFPKHSAACKIIMNRCEFESLNLGDDPYGAVLDQLIIGLQSRDTQWHLIQILVSDQLINKSRLTAALTCTSGPRAAGTYSPLQLLIDNYSPPNLPFPCLLTTQDLVELLKMPTIFGETRQVILAVLGNRYSRRFTNHWQFVRFAKERKLNLDFTTPPKRPDPAKSREAIVKALKGEPIPG